jgi:ribA/ribD-fused uncharacterized protein
LGNDDIYSNFYYFPFNHQGIELKWSEQAIMYRKANLFDAKTIADRILKAQTPKQCKDLGRSNEIPFDEKIWIANREIIYEDVLYDKFSNNNLKSEILATGDKILVLLIRFGVSVLEKTINVQKILNSGKV